MSGSKRKVVASAQEARMAQQAEAMKAAGFEGGVYGDTTPASFSVENDIKSTIQELGLMDDPTAIKVAQAATGRAPEPTEATAAPVAPQMPPQATQAPPEAQVPPGQEQAEEGELENAVGRH